jgi:hypothetical protein
MREVCRQISGFAQKLLLESLMCCRLFHRFANPISFSGLMFFFSPPEDLGCCQALLWVLQQGSTFGWIHFIVVVGVRKWQ